MSATLEYDDALSTLEELRAGSSADDLARAQSEVDAADTSLTNSQLDLRLVGKEWDEKLSSAREAVDSAEDEYEVVFSQLARSRAERPRAEI